MRSRAVYHNTLSGYVQSGLLFIPSSQDEAFEEHNNSQSI